ncbi:MAG: hypothetical protein U0821_19200 [Chloroflexota bacterium]
MRSIARLLVAALMVVPAVAAPLPAPTALARGADVCPEPNDSLQSSCYLGAASDAIGFISRPDDVDAYRIEVLDFRVDAHIELAERPLPYRVSVANWNGEILATGNEGVLDVKLGPPGAYYILVDSLNGQFSDGAAYRLSRQLRYPGSKIPDILYSNEFRNGAVPDQSVTEDADYIDDGGKFIIKVKSPAAPGQSKGSVSVWGPELTDFTLTVDARMEAAGEAGYHVIFRQTGNDAYAVIMHSSGALALGKLVGGTTQILGIALPETPDAGVRINRITVRCFKDDIRVVSNGKEVIRVKDATLKAGRFGFGAITNGPPPTIIFDNIIATTPAEG